MSILKPFHVMLWVKTVLENVIVTLQSGKKWLKQIRFCGLTANIYEPD